MVGLLAKIFIPQDMPTDRKRSAYGMLCGLVGIILNILLFTGKFIAGMLSNSIAITADAFNNLSDAGSSIVTLAGFKLAEQKPDSEHPFGHGRMEYVSGLIVAAIILIMAFELVKDSINKLIHPEDTEFSALVLAILIVSILVKCYMAFYNTRIGKQIGSATIHATATDSLNDCVATTVVLITTIIEHYSGFHLDGISGIFVGLFIFYGGISAAKDTLDPLLGQPPEKEFVDKIEQIVTTYDENIVGFHDLIVHDYGPGRRMVTLHAEVPADGDILKMHDIIDNIEMKLSKELGCTATIHMDPVITSDEHIQEMKNKVIDIVTGIDPVITLHDFRIVSGETHTNVIFDIVVPFRFRMSDEELTRTIKEQVKKCLGEEYFAVIQVDKDYNNLSEKR